MSQFWLGVFAGLAVWKAINAILSLAFYGAERRIGASEIAIELAFMTAFGMAAWYIATFGGV